MLGQPLQIPQLKAELFKALAHPARIQILEVLCEGEHAVGEIQPRVGIEPSHLSQQLAVLRKAGLVVTRKEGTSVHYSLRDPRIADLLAVAKQLLIAMLGDSQALLADLDESAPVRPGAARRARPRSRAAR